MMFELVTKQKHQFGDTRRIAPSASPTGCEQFERTCLRCPLVKITVIRHPSPRQWRFANGAQFVDAGGAPECVPAVEAVKREGAAAE